MRAYSVLELDERTGGIIFAPDKRTARRWGANRYADGDESYVEVSRRRDLDRYEGGGVPARVLVHDGWWFECHGCSIMIREEDMDEAGLPIDGIVGTEGGAVFCCHQCRMEYLSEKARREAFGEAFLDMLADRVRTRFGDSAVIEPREKHHVYVPTWHEPMVIKMARVAFRFPGMKHGAAWVEIRHEGPYGGELIGPARIEVFCPRGDQTAFQAWAATTKGAL